MAVALLTAACSADDNTADGALRTGDEARQPIVFAAYEETGYGWDDDARSRAEIADLGTLATSGFAAFAYELENGAAFGAQKPLYMYNQKVNSTDAGTTWKYTPVKFWPTDTETRLALMAYAPWQDHTATMPTTGITAISANDYGGAPTVSYKMGFKDNLTASEQTDLLWAVSPTDGLPLLNIARPALNQQTTLAFCHALAKVQFRVKNNTGRKLTLHSIDIAGRMAESATLSLKNTTPREPLWSAYSYKDDASMKWTLATPKDVDNGDTYTHSAAAFLALPQQFTAASPLTITLHLTLDDAVFGSQPLTAKASVATTLKGNRLNTLTLQLTPETHYEVEIE